MEDRRRSRNGGGGGGDRTPAALPMHDLAPASITQPQQSTRGDEKVVAVEVGSSDERRGEAEQQEELETPSTSGIPPPLTKKQLVYFAIIYIGLQFCWAVQVAEGGPVFIYLGVPHDFISYAWLAGPISGIVMQPLVAVFSDRCVSRFGRRRPFIWAGTGITIVCLLVLSMADVLGGLYVGIAGFWVFDFALNTVQGPARALLADIAPPSQQVLGNSALAAATGIGKMFAYLLGFVPWASVFPFLGFGLLSVDARVLFGIAAVFLTFCVAFGSYHTREVPLKSRTGAKCVECGSRSAVQTEEEEEEEEEEDDANHTVADSLIRSNSSNSNSSNQNQDQQENEESRFNAAAAARRFQCQPPWAYLWRVYAVQCCCWLAWLSFFVYATDFAGAIYGGDGNAAPGTQSRILYEDGVRIGNLGLTIHAIVALLYSFLLPFLTRWFGIRIMYLLLFLIQASCFLIPVVFFTAGAIVFSYALLGLAFASTQSLPWALCAVYVAESKNKGLWMAVNNLTQAGPQLVTALIAPALIGSYNHDLGAMFVFASVCAMVGGALVFIIHLPAEAVPSKNNVGHETMEKRWALK